MADAQPTLQIQQIITAAQASPVLDIQQVLTAAQAAPSLAIVQTINGVAAPTLQIQQTITAPRAEPTLAIRQTLYASAQPTLAIFQSVRGEPTVDQWRAGVVVGGVDRSARVTGVVAAQAEEDASGLCAFQIVAEEESFDPDMWVGELVQIDYLDTEADGTENWRIRRYTGYVALATYRPASQVILLTCTTDNQRRIYKLDRDQIASLVSGLWSKWVHAENATPWQYANDRLCTQKASLNADVHGQLSVRPWELSQSPRPPVTDSMHVMDSLDVKKPERTSLINTIIMDIDFRYPRLLQRDVAFNWMMGWNVCSISSFPDPPPRSVIADAVDKTDWTLIGRISYVPLPPSKWYICNGRPLGWLNWDREASAIGASFMLGKRWVQTVTESQRITVSSQASVAANGQNAIAEAYGIESAFDDAVWEETEPESTSPDQVEINGEVLQAVQAANGDTVFNADTLDGYRDAYNEAIEVLVSQARRQIAAHHRTNLITLQVPIAQAVELHQTMPIEISGVTAEGQVVAVADEMDVTTGRAVSTVTVAISRTSGAGLPDLPEEEIDYTPPEAIFSGTYEVNVSLPTYVGGTASSQEESEDWTGYIANAPYLEMNAPIYQRRFVVPTPEIDDAARQSVDAPIEIDYTAAVRNDPLEEFIPAVDIPFQCPDSPPVTSYIGFKTYGSGLDSSFIFSQIFTPPGPDRHLVVAVGSYSGALSVEPPSDVRVNGIGAAMLASASGLRVQTSFWIVENPDDYFIGIEVDFPNARENSFVALWSVRAPGLMLFNHAADTEDNGLPLSTLTLDATCNSSVLVANTHVPYIKMLEGGNPYSGVVDRFLTYANDSDFTGGDASIDEEEARTVTAQYETSGPGRAMLAVNLVGTGDPVPIVIEEVPQSGNGSSTVAYDYDFPSVDIGAAAADRLIVVGLTAKADNTTLISGAASVSVGGVSFTKIASSTPANPYTVIREFWAGVVPNGATATISVNCSNQQDIMKVVAWRLYGFSQTPVHVASVEVGQTDQFNDLAILPINTESGGCILATASAYGASHDFEWVNVAVNNTATINSYKLAAASAANTDQGSVVVYAERDFWSSGLGATAISLQPL